MDYTEYGTMLISEAPEATIFGFIAGLGATAWVVSLVIGIISIIALWMGFEKAGKPGWASIIPIYNAVVLLNIAGFSGWYILLMLVPIVNVFFGFYMNIKLAKAFGKSTGFGIGLILLNTIFVAILAFGDSKYIGNKKVEA